MNSGERSGIECKWVDAPQLTRSMRTAVDDLALDQLRVIYPGDRPYPLADRVMVTPLRDLARGAQFLQAS